mmetsp:Transcript_6466/g.11639  ORF Transcript_6466/g.11639 Transcript_6466/m.11639 type:complete len:200 (-) Transcript_6466:219-818(-)
MVPSMLRLGSADRSMPSSSASARTLFRKYGGTTRLNDLRMAKALSISLVKLSWGKGLPSRAASSKRGSNVSANATARAGPSFCASFSDINIRPGVDAATAAQSRFTKWIVVVTRASITPGGIVETSPKSRYPSRPSGVLSRLPPWGSACRNPFTSSCSKVHLMASWISSTSSDLTAPSPTSFSPSSHSVTITVLVDRLV